MIDFYNAFISYKHAELDSAIAEHIQTKLEHFHVPRKLRLNLKHPKITRIFRDKDELPTTSDLSATIKDALAKAEYLIVICSKNTKQSIWVKREINIFLETHSRDKILTVLCGEGEPFEVIPEELLTTEKEYQDADGVTRKVKVPIEPLSCDYRLSKRTADREELPRLASTILGCSYDELQRRRRQYRIRRAAIIAAVAFAGMAAFSSYMAYNKEQINNSYIESLRSKAVYLAHESTQLLKDGRRTDSVQLALSALPKSDDDMMPVTAASIRAITDATGAYVSRDGIGFKCAWNYKTPHSISSNIMSEDHRYIVAQDKVGSVYCWDTGARELVFEKQFKKSPLNVLFIDNETLLFVFDSQIEAYNIKSGASIWKYDIYDEYLLKGNVVCAAGSVYINNNKGSVIHLSGRDGNMKESYELRNGLINSIFDLTISPDGKKIAYSDSPFIFDGSKIHIYNTETGKDYAGELSDYMIGKMVFTDNDHLCILSSQDAFFSSIEYSTDMTFIQTGYMKCSCFDTSMNPLWSKDVDYNDVVRSFDIMGLGKEKRVLFYVGNTAVVFDVDTGKEINKFKMSSSIITASDYDNNGLAEFICRHGEYIFQVNGEKNNLAQLYLRIDNVAEAFVCDALYVIQDDSNDIVCYTAYQQDDDWEAVKAPGSFYLGTDYNTVYQDEDMLIVCSTLGDTKSVRISIIDLNEGKLRCYSDDEDVGSIVSNLKIDKIGDKFYAVLGNSIYTINTSNAKLENTGMKLDYSDYYTNGKIIHSEYKNDYFYVTVKDITGKSKELSFSIADVDSGAFRSGGKPLYVRDLNTVFFPVKTRLFAADLETEKVSEIKVPKGWNASNGNKIYVNMSEDHSKIIFSDKNTIMVTDESYKQQFSIRCDCTSRCGAVFKDNVLYVAADNNLGLYNGDSGDIIGRYDMSTYGSGDAIFTFDDNNNELMIKTGSQISLFDTKAWVETASIYNVLCYHKASDRFYVYSYFISSECTPGYIKHYTLADLIEKAKRYLHGHELDEVTKTKYGL